MRVRYPIVTNLCKELDDGFVSGPRAFPSESSEFRHQETSRVWYSIKKNPGRVSDKS
jgi:hypothetical protein